MPRGVYERKGKEELPPPKPGQPIYGVLSPKGEPMLCQSCRSWQPGETHDAHQRLTGLCHFMPAAVSVHEGHRCRQWEGKP